MTCTTPNASSNPKRKTRPKRGAEAVQRPAAQPCRHLTEGADAESYHEVPPRVEYSMTEPGRQLLDALEPLGDWATNHIDMIVAADQD